MKPPTKCGRVHFEHRHRKWSVITVRPTTSVRKSPRKNLPSRNTPDSFCRLLHPTKSIAALRGRYFSFMVTCRGGGPSILLTQDRSVAQKPHWGFHCFANANFPKKTNNPNPSPIGNKFGLFLFGPSGENRTHGLLNPIVLLSKTQCTIRYCLDSVSLNFKYIISFCFIGCQDVSFLLWSNCGQTTPTNDFSPPAKLHRAISIFINRSCAFCLHELSIRRICQPCQ